MRSIGLGRFLRGSALLMLLLTAALAQDWAEFRGANRSGTSTATGLPVHFDPRTNVAWTVDVPMGRSSPIVKGNRVFLTAADKESLTLFAYDIKTGKRLWRYSIERRRRNEID